jgi:hypothetical protein
MLKHICFAAKDPRSAHPIANHGTKCGHRRNDDGDCTKRQEKYTLDEIEYPMLVERFDQRAAKLVWA